MLPAMLSHQAPGSKSSWRTSSFCTHELPWDPTYDQLAGWLQCTNSSTEAVGDSWGRRSAAFPELHFPSSLQKTPSEFNFCSQKFSLRLSHSRSWHNIVSSTSSISLRQTRQSQMARTFLGRMVFLIAEKSNQPFSLSKTEPLTSFLSLQTAAGFSPLSQDYRTR